MTAAARSVVLAVVASGCLGDPSPPGADMDDAAVRDAAILDAALSDGAALDGPEADALPPGGASFPPGDITVNLIASAVADIDGDGRDDLLLANDTGDDATRGVFVLLGGTDRQLDRYHAYLEVGDAIPVAVTAADLNGDDAVEVIVFGRIADTVTGRLLVFPGAGGGAFGAPMTRDTPHALYTDEYRLATVTTGAFAGNDNLDIAIGSNSAVAVLTVDAWDALFGTNSFTLIEFTDENPNHILGVAPAGTSATRDDLVIAQVGWVTLVDNGGDGAFDGARHTNPLPITALSGATIAQLDDTGAADVLGNGLVVGERVGAVLVDSAGGAAYRGELTDVLYYDAMRVLALDADPRPDVVVLTRGPLRFRLHLNLAFDAAPEPDALVFTTTRPDFDPELEGVADAVSFQVGQFDGDAPLELYAHTATGAAVCVEVLAAGLVACP